jgi:hypothetical protein
VSPGRLLVVEDAVTEAAMQEADEAVGEGAQGAVVCVAGLPSAVVEGSGAGARGEGGEGPQVAGVGEAAVPGVAARTTRLVPDALVMGDVPA